MFRIFALGLTVALASCTTPDAGAMICTPGTTRCGNQRMKSQTAERCNATGTQWVVEAVCMTLCTSGSCSVPPSSY